MIICSVSYLCQINYKLNFCENVKDILRQELSNICIIAHLPNCNNHHMVHKSFDPVGLVYFWCSPRIYHIFVLQSKIIEKICAKNFD